MADVHTYLAKIAELAQALQVLGWDQQTYMPPGAATARAEQMASLSSVIYERATADRGEYGRLLGWLREHIHQHGRAYTPNELIERATGSPLMVVPYLDYLRAKFGALYDIGT